MPIPCSSCIRRLFQRAPARERPGRRFAALAHPTSNVGQSKPCLPDVLVRAASEPAIGPAPRRGRGLAAPANGSIPSKGCGGPLGRMRSSSLPLRQDCLPAGLFHRLESEKTPPTVRHPAPSTRPYIPCPPRRTRKPPPAPPAHWALPPPPPLVSRRAPGRGASPPGPAKRPELRR